MAFIVEDGTGVVDANALITVAELDGYLSDRNETNTYTQQEKEAAIIVASVDYIDTFFCFDGNKLNDDQGMQIPTSKVPLNRDIKRAASMAALLDLKGRLFVDPTDVTQKVVTEEECQVGTLMDRVKYQDNGASYTTKYPTTAIDRILNKYATGSGLGGLVRG